MKNQLEYFLFAGLSKVFCFVGLKRARKFASAIAFLFFYIIPIRKKVVIQNLQIAFPEKSQPEINSLAYKTYLNLSIVLVEILCFPNFSAADFINEVEVVNANLVNEKYKEGNGLVLLSAHFGNWELGAIALGLVVNLSFSIVAKAQRNPFVDRWMNKYRSQFSMKLVPLGISIRQIYQELKEKKIIALVGDQRGPSEGIRVNFFGKPSATYPGPAALAIKCNAPILMIVSSRRPGGKYVLEVVEIDLKNLPEKEEDKIIEVTQRHTNYLEKMIEQYPEQWLWMHKRWKY